MENILQFERVAVNIANLHADGLITYTEASNQIIGAQAMATFTTTNAEDKNVLKAVFDKYCELVLVQEKRI